MPLGYEQLPSAIKEELDRLAEKTGVGVEEIMREYNNLFFSEFVQNDPQFKSDTDRHHYVLQAVVVRLASQPPAKEFIVIPYGYTGVRMTKKGVLMCRIYALVRRGDKFENRIIICRGPHTNLIQSIQTFSVYRVYLSEVGSLLSAVPKTSFENPKPIPIDPVTFLLNEVNVKKFQLKDCLNSLSRMVEGGFVDEMDLRAIQGIVLRYNYGTRPDGTMWGVYEISDYTVTYSGISPDGKVIPTSLTVWVDPSFIRWDIDSEVLAVGTLQLSRDNEPLMNSICIVPIHGKPLVRG